MQGRFGLDGHCALATLLAAPAEEHLLRAARRITGTFSTGLAAATCVDGVLACRALGSDMLRIQALMRELWRTLRPLHLDRDALAPRIWAT